MAHCDDVHESVVDSNGVDNSVVSDSKAPQVVGPFELTNPSWARIRGQILDSREYLRGLGFGKLFQFLSG